MRKLVPNNELPFAVNNGIIIKLFFYLIHNPQLKVAIMSTFHCHGLTVKNINKKKDMIHQKKKKRSVTTYNLQKERELSINMINRAHDMNKKDKKENTKDNQLPLPKL